MSREIKNSAVGDMAPDKNKEQEKLTVRILIVDDEILYRKSLLFGLKFEEGRDGFSTRIDEADNLVDALKQLEQDNYEVVITDGVFPEKAGGFVSGLYEQDFRGNQVVKAAKDKGVKLVIGISSEPQGFKEADVVFAKPVEITELKEVIKKSVKTEAND